MSQEYSAIYGPEFTRVSGTYGDPHGEWVGPIIEELLEATGQGFGKVGVTLAPGQGVLRAGSGLTMRGDGLYVKFGAVGGGDAEGLLYKSVNTGTSTTGRRFEAKMITGAVCKNSVVEAADNDAGLAASLGASVNANRDTFTFRK